MLYTATTGNLAWWSTAAFATPGFGDLYTAIFAEHLGCFSVCGSACKLSAFSLDVKAAHNTMRVAESDQGLLGVQADGKHYFYSVCPFGAVFSALWFARLGSFFARSLHLLIYICRILLLYVDDLLPTPDVAVIDITASLCLAFCVCFNIPLSWAKLQLGPNIQWIGWSFHLRSGAFSVPLNKRDRLAMRIRGLLSCPDKVHRRDLHKAAGMLYAFPAARAWVGCLYRDLNSQPASCNFTQR